MVLWPCVTLFAQSSGQKHIQLEYSGPAMGVELKIIVFAPDDDTGRLAINAAVARVAELEQILSNYREDSEVNQLARQLADGPVVVSDDLWTVLRRAQAIGAASENAFDVTLAPLTDLWREARESGTLPHESAIAAARRLTGYQRIEVDLEEQSIRAEPGTRFDFGGIGKGYAAAEALKVLAARGCRRALVDLGGDLAIGQRPPDKPGWSVQISPVEWEQNDTTEYIVVADCGVATSGYANQFVEIDGIRYSHILNPRTGVGLQRQTAITVVSFDATEADGLASAFSVLDRNVAMITAERMSGCGLLIRERSSDSANVRSASSGFPEIQSLDGSDE